jgi:hypothetical protein
MTIERIFNPMYPPSIAGTAIQITPATICPPAVLPNEKVDYPLRTAAAMSAPANTSTVMLNAVPFIKALMVETSSTVLIMNETSQLVTVLLHEA